MKCFSIVYRNNQMRLLLSCNVVNGRNRIPKAHPFFHSLSFHMPCNYWLKAKYDVKGQETEVLFIPLSSVQFSCSVMSDSL